MDEAKLVKTEYGLVAEDQGWFTVNVRDSSWVTHDSFGDACIFEGGAYEFPHVGYTLAVLQPGQPNGMYHHEADQEDFLVLQGEALLIVEGQERPLKAWDFFHSPPGTAHILVGAGTGPCVIFMAGSRVNRGVHTYVRDDAALKHGAGPERDTVHSQEAYAPFPKHKSGPPPSWEGLPWS